MTISKMYGTAVKKNKKIHSLRNEKGAVRLFGPPLPFRVVRNLYFTPIARRLL